MAVNQHTQTRPKDRGFPRIYPPSPLIRLISAFSRYGCLLRFTGQRHRPRFDISRVAEAIW